MFQNTPEWTASGALVYERPLSLFGSGPINGCDAQQTLAWIYRGGGLDLYKELLVV